MSMKHQLTEKSSFPIPYLSLYHALPLAPQIFDNVYNFELK